MSRAVSRWTASHPPLLYPAVRMARPAGNLARICLNPERSAESSGGVVGLCAVVIKEDRVVAAIAEEGTAEFSDWSRGLHPARCLRIEGSEFLQLSILLFGEKLNAHGGGHVHRAALGLVFFSRVQGFAVEAKAAAVFRALGGAIVKKVFARLLVMADNIGFTAGSFHFMEGPQLPGAGFEPGLHFGPRKAFVAVHVLLKASLQSFEKVFTLFL